MFLWLTLPEGIDTTPMLARAVERKVAYARMDEILSVLGDYYRTVLKRPNTKAQAAHCIAQIRNLSPGYAEGLTTKMKTVKP